MEVIPWHRNISKGKSLLQSDWVLRLSNWNLPSGVSQTNNQSANTQYTEKFQKQLVFLKLSQFMLRLYPLLGCACGFIWSELVYCCTSLQSEMKECSKLQWQSGQNLKTLGIMRTGDKNFKNFQWIKKCVFYFELLKIYFHLRIFFKKCQCWIHRGAMWRQPQTWK